MKLVYRGIRYNVTPGEVQIPDMPVKGQYRGSTVTLNQIQLPMFQHILHLVYRGVAYDEAIATPNA